MIAHLALVATLSLGTVFEAPPEVSAPALTQETNEAIAERMIASANAQGIFVNSSNAEGAQVTHVASGMTCRFQGNASDRLTVFPDGNGRPRRGDDVGCGYRDEALGIDINLYATRYSPAISEREALQNATAAIQNRWPDATPYTGSLTSAAVEGQSAPLASAFRVQNDGSDLLTLVMVSHRRDWAFKVRATGPYEQATGVSLYTSMVLQSALMKGPAN